MSLNDKKFKCKPDLQFIVITEKLVTVGLAFVIEYYYIIQVARVCQLVNPNKASV